MTVEFDAAFARDLKKRKGDVVLLTRIRAAVLAAEAAAGVGDLPNFQFLAGGGGYGRIRVGDFRLGAKVDGRTFRFMRCLHRSDIYRAFP